MVGLPYPNIYSPELKEKMTYLDATLGVSFSLCVDYLSQNRREIISSRHWNLLRECSSTILLISWSFGEVFQITIFRVFISLNPLYY